MISAVALEAAITADHRKNQPMNGPPTATKQVAETAEITAPERTASGATIHRFPTR
jgi:hypothetical protein